jgi:O-antigen ligase
MVRNLATFLLATLPALLIVLELRTKSVPAWAALGGGAALVAVLGLAVARLEAAVALGVALMLVVKFEPAPTDAVFLVVIAVAAVTGRLVVERVPLPVVLFAGGLLAVNFVAFSEAVDVARASRFLFVTFYLVAFGLWLAGWTSSQARARLVLRSYVFAAVAAAMLGVSAMLLPVPGRSNLVEYGGTRAVGLFKDPNVFGAFLVPAALMVIDEVLKPRLLRSRKSTKAGMFVLLTLGVVFSFSRAAWISLALGICVLIAVFALRRGAARRALAILLAVGATIAVVGVALAATGSTRFLQQRAQVQTYDTQRFGAQAQGIRLAEQHPIGIGPGQFELYSPLSAHSTYVRALAEEGVLGIVILVGLFLTTFVLAARNAALGRETWGIGSAPLLAAWSGLLLSSFVIDTLHWRHLWLVAALIWAGSARPGSGS